MNIRTFFTTMMKSLSPLRRDLRFPLLAVLALSLLCPCLFSQTNWAVDATLPSYGEFNSPPPGAMTNPMPYAMMLPPPPVPPPGIAPFPPLLPTQGGSAYDTNGNPLTGGFLFPAMIHSDGIVVEMDTVGGLFVTSFVVPGPFLPGMVSGVGYDSAADIFWLTDGAMCTGLGLPPAPGAPPPVVVPPFPLPVPAPPASGLGWDPITGTLWFCDAGGQITNCTIGGALLVTFPAPILPPPLMGLTVNTTNGNIQVTDGAGLVSEVTPAGAPAPVGPFYLSANPYPIPLWAGPISGLAFTVRPQRFGAGYSTTGPPPAIAATGGDAYAGNTGFTLTETGATIGSTAYIVYGFAPAIPGRPLPGYPGATVWIKPISGILWVGPVTTGTVNVRVRIPAPAVPGGVPVGAPVFIQFLNITNPGPPMQLELSDALSLTIGQL